MRRRLLAAVCVAVTTLAAPALAQASELIDRNATCVDLAVNVHGEALLTYVVERASRMRTDVEPAAPRCSNAQRASAERRGNGELRRVLAWGAVDAIPPSPTRRQVEFKLDYSGGWKKHRTHHWETFRNACRPYRGEDLSWLVVACEAPDGSSWAIQSWQRALPNYGLQPTAKQAVWELRLSHWTGPLPQLEIELAWTKWGPRSYDQLFGTFTYFGKPVHGFRSTPQGVPLDTHGRNLYVDTLDSAYGAGWKRENGFLAQAPSGGFCYGFYPHGSRPIGRGVAYRATIIGPGVTPDAFWTAAARGEYEEAADAVANVEQAKIFAGSRYCQKS